MSNGWIKSSNFELIGAMRQAGFGHLARGANRNYKWIARHFNHAFNIWNDTMRESISLKDFLIAMSGSSQETHHGDENPGGNGGNGETRD